MKKLRDTKEGLILSIKVIARAKKHEIVGWQGDMLKIKVRALPEKGEANQAIICLLAETFHLPQSKVVLLRGATATQKEFMLIGYTSERFLLEAPWLISDD